MKENADHDDCCATERYLFLSAKKAPKNEIALRVFKISETTENI